MKLAYFFREFKTSASLALPLILTQLLDNTLGLVDTLVAGRLGADALAALAIANGVFWAVVCVAQGLLAGLDVFIARAFGERNYALADRLLVQGLWLSLFASLLTIIGVLLIIYSYGFAELSEKLFGNIWQYTLWVLPTAPLVLLMSVFQRYWQSQSFVKPFTVLLVALNLFNYCLNVSLVEGYFGPAMGVTGIAFATTLCRLIAFISVLIGTVFAWKKQGRSGFSWQPDWLWLRRLLNFDVPSTGHLVSDVFAFNVMTFFAASLGAIAVAANQIMFMVTCVTVMVPLGISHAAAIRVGQCIGAGQNQAALHIAYFNTIVTTVLLVLIGLFILFFATEIAMVFTVEPALIAQTKSLIQLCGLFQVVDGLQVLYAGILRAWGEVSKVFKMSLVAHYAVGLPLALLLCFYFDFEVLGLWFGMTAGLAASFVFNLYIWHTIRTQQPRVCV